MNFYSIYSMIDTVTVFLLLLFTLFLLTVKHQTLSNRLLAAALFALAMAYMDGVFLSFNIRFHDSWQHIVFATMSFDFLVGPLLYLYILSRTQSGFSLRLKHGLHILPFLLHFSFIYGLMLLNAINTDSSIFGPHRLFDTTQVKVLTSLSNLFYASYMLLVIVTLFKYQRQLKQQYSDIHKKNMLWLVLVSTALFFSGLLRYSNNLWWLQAPYDPFHNFLDLKLFAISGVLVFAVTAVFQTMRNAAVLKIPSESEPDTEETSPPKNGKIRESDLGARYKTSTLSSEQLNTLKSQLLDFMNTEKPFLKSDLSLSELASSMKIPSHHLSQLINTVLGKNFYDFVNGFRIEESKRLLCNAAKKKNTITQIMQDVGFNSKSVFNTAFKKSTGMTPSEFRSKHAQEEQKVESKDLANT